MNIKNYIFTVLNVRKEKQKDEKLQSLARKHRKKCFKIARFFISNNTSCKLDIENFHIRRELGTKCDIYYIYSKTTNHCTYVDKYDIQGYCTFNHEDYGELFELYDKIKNRLNR